MTSNVHGQTILKAMVFMGVLVGISGSAFKIYDGVSVLRAAAYGIGVGIVAAIVTLFFVGATLRH
jgi:hypothetical protein